MLGGGQEADRGVKPGRVAPVDPLGGGALDVDQAGPRVAVEIDELSLLQLDRGFHECSVERVADGADRTGDPRIERRFGERQ